MHQKGSAAAWLKVEEAKRERDAAQKRATRNGWLATGAFALAACQFIYAILKGH